jgi:glucosamine--fructose-6-phosphate aminotransferase (isomerizing)
MHTEKEQYEAFHTWKEIVSQGEAWRGVLEELARDEIADEFLNGFSEAQRCIFVGCGTSYYLAEAAARSWAMLTGQPAHPIPASEVLLFPNLLLSEGKGLCAITISRSGQTSETVRAARILRQELRIPTFGISCARASDLEKSCQGTIVLSYCDETSTVMTKSFTGMLLALQFLAARFANNPQFIADLRTMADRFSLRISALGDLLEEFNRRNNFENFVFLGQGAFYGIAREASLKLMEMSCSYSQFFHTLEFRHGPRAIVSPKACVTFFLGESTRDVEVEVLQEVKEAGGTTVAICNRTSTGVSESADLVIEMKADVPELALLAPYSVPGQFSGFFQGIRKGLNPDEPRNLSRVVILD